MTGPSAGLIYLDSNATTVLAPEVAAAMADAQAWPANAGSVHWAGRRARSLLDQARTHVSRLLHGQPSEIVFTSGATEANALALEGVARAHRGARRKIVSVVSEHPAVLEPLERLRIDGWTVELVGLESDGRPRLDQLEDAIDDNTLLVTLMAANNETGVLGPVKEVSSFCLAHGALLHTDATQLVPWQEVDVDSLGVDLLSLSGHKMHGPQGIGALFVSRDVQRTSRLAAMQPGGGQEEGLRGGTVNVAGAIGLGEACRLVTTNGAEDSRRVAAIRSAMEQRLLDEVASTSVNGNRSHRTPGTSNVCFGGTPGEAIMAGAPDVAMSTGSACTAGSPAPSHVLLAMGLAEELADSSLRLSLSSQTTADEANRAVDEIKRSVDRIRSLELTEV